MPNVKPYSLDQAQSLVRDAVDRSETRHKHWRILEALYRTGSVQQAEQQVAGKLTDLQPDLHDHVVNLVKPHLDIILASVIARDPQHVCTPFGGGELAERNAKVSEGVLDYFWKRAAATDELKAATEDSVKLGSGFVKAGWSHLEEEYERDQVDVQEDAMFMANTLELMGELGEELEDGDTDLDALVGAIPSVGTRVITSEPVVSYASPYDVFVPVDCRQMDDTRWVAHRVTLPVDEVLANPELKATEETLLRDGRTTSNDEYQAEWRRQTEDSKGVAGNAEALDTATLWEFYDMRARTLTIFQINGDKPLWQGDLPYSHRYPPFVHVTNYRSSGNDFWGFGELENIATIQGLFNEFLTEEIENARRAGQKYLIAKDVVTDELKNDLENSEGDITIPVDVPNGQPLDQLIVPVFRAALSDDIYKVKDELEQAVQKVLGVNDFQAGGVGADRMSATAAAVVDGVATLRAQDKIASVERAASGLGNRILLLCQEMLDQPTAVRISGVAGATWLKVSKEDIYGEFRVTVEGGSTRAVNPATREQQGMRTLSEVLPVLVELGYDPTPALRQGLRDLGYDPEVVLAGGPQPAPAPVPGGGPQGGAPAPPGQGAGPSNGELMMERGGPPMPAAAQAVGDVIL